MNRTPVSSPPGVFKGIALFTPGGDLIYCIDPHKQNRWHLQLCMALQEQLGLPELPHFLVPCYTATVDRWWDVRTQAIQTAAEACPHVIRYAGLLNAAFGLQGIQWTPTPCREDLCDPELLNSHRQQFPQLWNHHNLIARFKDLSTSSTYTAGKRLNQGDHISQMADNDNTVASTATQATQQGFVLRLFVSGRSTSTEPTLRKLHHALETSLEGPYSLKVIDVYRNPEQAEMDQITATPTLLKVWPPPSKRIVGNLDNMEQLLSILTHNHG
ncbi:MAG: circadian clock KaiB family protein [Cyanobacteria bacterium P01_F01_bin.150]